MVLSTHFLNFFLLNIGKFSSYIPASYFPGTCSSSHILKIVKEEHTYSLDAVPFATDFGKISLHLHHVSQTLLEPFLGISS